MTVFVTTHYMDEAEYCDRLGLIYRGELIALGTPHELKSGMTRDAGGAGSASGTPAFAGRRVRLPDRGRDRPSSRRRRCSDELCAASAGRRPQGVCSTCCAISAAW